MIQQILDAKRPVLYTGGGIVNSGAVDSLLSFAESLHVPVTPTLMGLGGFPSSHPLCLGMLGMHGTYAANMAVAESDLLVALGVRFDDRVTGKLATFAPHARVIHVDIDPANIGKNVTPTLALTGDVKQALDQFLALIQEQGQEQLQGIDSEARSVVESNTSLAALATAALLRLTKPNQTANCYSRIAPANKRRCIDRDRRGPTSDVGSSILSVHKTATTDYQRRTRNNGVWIAGGDGSAARAT